MAGTGKYLDIVNGVPTQKAAVVASAGASDADELVKLDGNGLLDESMMPLGIGADTASILASENLVAGDLVNIWQDAGISKIRKADATTIGKEANGFVTASVTAAALGSVYFEGKNEQLSGLTIGATLFLSTVTAGAVSSTPPAGSGNVVQQVGKVISATSMSFEPAQLIVLA